MKLKESFGDLERAVKVFTVRDYEVECKGGVPGTLKRTKLGGHGPGRQGRGLQGPRQQRAHDGQARRPHRP